MENSIWDKGRLADPHGQPDKARRVRAMFDRIAPSYERVNRILSAGRDARWRRVAVEMARVRPADRVLDLACGTGDLTRALARARPAVIVGADFTEQMLRLAAERDRDGLSWCRGDALALPFADGSFSVVACAFGVRNFEDLSCGLREMRRVLERGGRAVILEFTLPDSRILCSLYRSYFWRIVPVAARLISRDRTGAYDYLPHSVESFFDARGMVGALERAGFEDVRYRALTLGIVTVYLAGKP
ncbi:MAG: bifunctional demethylmenaquinone methyltransferase/2-methoxy-6-polyprenyl-1,4-benzoquinol methylase UbiE [Phycisphaerae bacterium]